MASATHEGLMTRDVNICRLFILSRSFFSGMQMYSWIDTRGKTEKWSHVIHVIRINTIACISGQSFIGSDIGSFHSSSFDELSCSRCVQYEALTFPFFRMHDYAVSFIFEKYRTVYSQFVETMKLRYQLFPL